LKCHISKFKVVVVDNLSDLSQKTNLRFRQSLQTFIEVVSNNYPRISCKMGVTIKEKAFLLDYFRKRVKQEKEDWPYFVPPYTEEF
jgi:hypothetical protein